MHELVLACSPPPPPRPQISYTILSQADCVRSGSGSLRVGPPLGHNHGIGSARELVTVGAWDAAQRCATGFGRRLQRVLPGVRVLLASTRGDPLDEVYARARLSALRPPPSVPNSRLTQIRHWLATSCVFCFQEFSMSRKKKSSWTADAFCRLDTSCALWGGSAQEVEPHGDGPDGDVAPFYRVFSCRRDYLRAQPVRRSPCQSATPSGESFVSNGLAWSTSNCSQGMRDPLAFAAQANHTAHGDAHRRIRACRRIPFAARTGVMVLAARRQTAPALGEQTVSTTQNWTSGSGTWMWLGTTAHVPLDRCFNSTNGSFFESLSSLTARPILADPSVEVPSPNPIGSPSARPRTPSASLSWFRPLSTTDWRVLHKRFPFPLCQAKHQWTVRQSI